MILDGQIPITTRVDVRRQNRPQRSVAVFQKCGAGEDLVDVAAAAGR